MDYVPQGFSLEIPYNKSACLRVIRVSFRFKDEDDYEYKIFSVYCVGKSQHHFGENVIVVGTSYQTNVRGFIIL